MKVAICCDAKLENDYIKFWCDYHFKLGIDAIYICDNNIDSSSYNECFDDVIKDYIDSGKVIIIDYRNKHQIQVESYKNFYKHYSSLYDWIAFIDVDEFITIKKFDNIKNYLNQQCFLNYDSIRLNWFSFDDNGKLSPKEDIDKGIDKGNVIDRFPIARDLNWCCRHGFIENEFCKSITRGSLNNNIDITPHVVKGVSCCDDDGNCLDLKINWGNTKRCSFNSAYIRHYNTKTIEEYLLNKCIRGDVACKTVEESMRRYTMDYFFKRNKYTKEKDEYARELIKKYKLNLK